MADQRYTLSLPPEIYNELREQAEEHGTSIKEVVRQCLKIGLIVIKIAEDPNADLYIKEKLPQPSEDGAVVKETLLQFVW